MLAKVYSHPANCGDFFPANWAVLESMVFAVVAKNFGAEEGALAAVNVANELFEAVVEGGVVVQEFTAAVEGLTADVTGMGTGFCGVPFEMVKEFGAGAGDEAAVGTDYGGNGGMGGEVMGKDLGWEEFGGTGVTRD